VQTQTERNGLMQQINVLAEEEIEGKYKGYK
jgi:hypothetical protein